jgi:hypothetical protein
MNNHVIFKPQNGLGDKILDIIGFYVICKYLNYMPNIGFNHIINQYAWGNNDYDTRLFVFRDFILSDRDMDNRYDFFLESPNPSVSLSPYKVYEFLHGFLPEIDFEQVSKSYNLFVKEIVGPSEIILSKIPYHIEHAYGIHLRKSDKIQNHSNGHENSIDEFQIIIQKLLDDVKNIVLNEHEPFFFIVSEDSEWKNEITNSVKEMGFIHGKNVNFVVVDYTNENNYSNYNSVLDLFCLSRCKMIFQGVKYSTFSILSALLGNGKIVNYSHVLDNNYSIVYNWNSVVEINGKLKYDVEFYKNYTFCTNLITNIANTYE